MIVLGIDPGSRFVGVAVLDVRAEGVTGRALYVAHDVLDVQALGEERVLLAIAAHLAHGVRLAGIERPERVASAVMASAMLRTSWIAGRIAQALAVAAVRVHPFPAETWRTHFFGQAAVKNAPIATLIELHVTGWPKKSNEHARDAAAVALYAAVRG